MTELTIRSPLLHARTATPLTAAQRAVVWEICALLDEQRAPSGPDDAVWLEASTARLRGPGARSDNVWLRECLERLLGVKFSGQNGDDPWGAVLLAEYKISRDVVRLLLPPSAIRALRLPQTFAKIDAETAHRLPPNARTLYGLIADKFRLNKPEWLIGLDDLKGALGLSSSQYSDFFNFKRRVLNPSTDAINQFGVCNLTWEPVKLGLSVRSIRFRWTLKQMAEAETVAKENGRHRVAKGKTQEDASAPPLAPQMDIDDQSRALRWRDGLPVEQRAALASQFAKGPNGMRPYGHPGLWLDAWTDAGKP